MRRWSRCSPRTSIASSASSPWRSITLAHCLSGGVDSSVASLIAAQCVHAPCDVDALRRWTGGPLPVTRLIDVITNRTPLHKVLQTNNSGGGNGSQYSGAQHKQSTVVHKPLFMRNWRIDDHSSDEKGDSSCCHSSTTDLKDAQLSWQRITERCFRDCTQHRHVAELDFSAEYWHRCMMPLLEAQQRGRGCNVDAMCNSQIKFGALLDYLVANWDQNVLVVTGHYARVVIGDDEVAKDEWRLFRPYSIRKDHNDQTHFLATLQQRQLSRAVFPLGALFESKIDVRRVAKEMKLIHVAEKKTSTGLCFVPRSAKRGGSGSFPMWIEKVLADEGMSHEQTTASICTHWFFLSGDGEEAMVKKVSVHFSRNDHRSESATSLFSSHAFTVGERITADISISGGSRTTRGGRNTCVRHAYVAQVHLDKSERWARRILLVETFDHPSLMQQSVAIQSLHSTTAIQVSPCADETTSWMVAFRHLDPPKPCRVVTTAQADEPNDKTAHATDMCGRVILLAEARVRAPGRGQLVVFYRDAPADKGTTGDRDEANMYVVGHAHIS